MNRKIDLKPERCAIVHAILREHLLEGANIWVFGARARTAIVARVRT